jgi:hypothetical protein
MASPMADTLALQIYFPNAFDEGLLDTLQSFL